MKNIAIFASGKGSNAQAIIEYFKGHSSIQVALIVTNNPSAGVIKVAHSNKIISAILTKEAFSNQELMFKLLDALNIELIVLAGFLQLVPPYLLEKFPNRVINIHPALLPKFGGKGMYGMKVHEAVLAAKETETGITIHYVNAHYDEGQIIEQYTVPVLEKDKAESISKKVQALEHKWYPKAIEKILA